MSCLIEGNHFYYNRTSGTRDREFRQTLLPIFEVLGTIDGSREERELPVQKSFAFTAKTVRRMANRVTWPPSRWTALQNATKIVSIEQTVWPTKLIIWGQRARYRRVTCAKSFAFTAKTVQRMEFWVMWLCSRMIWLRYAEKIVSIEQTVWPKKLIIRGQRAR